MSTPQANAARLEEGMAHHQAGRLDEAEACYLDVITAEPTNTEALKLMALAMVGKGDLDDALSYALAATELKPDNGDYQHLAGRIYLDGGDTQSALSALQKALVNNPTDLLDVNLDLASCYAAMGLWDDSLAIAEAQVRAYPTDVRSLHTAASAATGLEKTQLAIDYLERALRIENNDAVLLADAAKAYRVLGNLGHAWQYVERALAAAPGDANAHYMARIIRTEAVPAWHFNMMNDATRNTVFKRAIERQIKPHHVVLEIGTGAGLLAMMASRTGATVYSCESNSALAMTARGLIAHNGLTNRITVIDKPSWEVEVGAELPRKADVLIAEIFSAQLLSEEVIPTIEDAKRRLLKPGGIVIPAMGTMMGALVRNDELAQLTRVGMVDGFDFTSFSAFTPVIMNLDTPNYALDWLSEPTSLFSFDFQNQDIFPSETGQVAVDVTADGLCQGVVQWIQLHLDDETIYENAPVGANATRTKHWTPLFYPFPIPRELKKGQTVMLRIGHDRKGCRLEVAEVI